ncbi:Phosphoglycolate phosphatase [Jannaschia seosinensis]|uniref:phosphoglycolate phosphatase n=1 Tax=Jannaschia seosinensis TaxID=313367 RepID=A0A0M7BEB2_9RHOB|nr:HAD family hydrolase [Jannaschia seosinensis]CUH40529.1 Phosphoglycolate phosphatase [Jannaschia seosinensis]
MIIKAILFDKDGTLTDFRATWEAWMPGMIYDLARESGVSAPELGHAIGLDVETGRIRPDGRFVTASGPETNAAIATVTGWSVARVTRWIGVRAQTVQQVMVPGVPATIARLAAAGLPMGVLTNADEAEARRHLAEMGILEAMTRVIGWDSGFGPKPDPRGAAEFAKELGFEPSQIVLVGDGLTDMMAAYGAGLVPVGVLSGTLDAAALRPHTATILTDVTSLPDWLMERGVLLPTA